MKDSARRSSARTVPEAGSSATVEQNVAAAHPLDRRTAPEAGSFVERTPANNGMHKENNNNNNGGGDTRENDSTHSEKDNNGGGGGVTGTAPGAGSFVERTQPSVAKDSIHSEKNDNEGGGGETRENDSTHSENNDNGRGGGQTGTVPEAGIFAREEKSAAERPLTRALAEAGVIISLDILGVAGMGDKLINALNIGASSGNISLVCVCVYIR